MFQGARLQGARFGGLRLPQPRLGQLRSKRLRLGHQLCWPNLFGQHRQHGRHRLLQTSAGQGTGQANQQQGQAQGWPNPGQLLQAPTRQAAATHQQAGDGKTGQPQGPGAIAAKPLGQTAQAADPPAHHHHRMGPAGWIAQEPVEAAGQQHQHKGVDPNGIHPRGQDHGVSQPETGGMALIRRSSTS